MGCRRRERHLMKNQTTRSSACRNRMATRGLSVTKTYDRAGRHFRGTLGGGGGETAERLAPDQIRSYLLSLTYILSYESLE